MGNSFNWLWETIAFLLTLAMALYQAKLFDKNKVSGLKFTHWTWAAFYINIMIWAYFIDHSISLVAEILLIRMILFNPSLNLLRTPKKYFFYMSNGSTPGSSWVDAIETKLYGPIYPFTWGLYIALFVFLNVKYHGF